MINAAGPVKVLKLTKTINAADDAVTAAMANIDAEYEALCADALAVA